VSEPNDHLSLRRDDPRRRFAATLIEKSGNCENRQLSIANKRVNPFPHETCSSSVSLTFEAICLKNYREWTAELCASERQQSITNDITNDISNGSPNDIDAKGD
jgi:hypothetical protein